MMFAEELVLADVLSWDGSNLKLKLQLFTSLHFKSVTLFSVIVLLRDYFRLLYLVIRDDIYRYVCMYVLSFEFIVTTTFVLCRYLLLKAKEIKCG